MILYIEGVLENWGMFGLCEIMLLASYGHRPGIQGVFNLQDSLLQGRIA